MSLSPIPPVASAWWSDASISNARSSKHTLVALLREVIADLALLDTEETGDETFRALQAQCVRLRDALRQQPSLRRKGGPLKASPADRPLTERGPISGRSNALAAPMMPLIDSISGDTVRAHAVFSTAYEGPQGFVHGGMVLAVFDEVLALAQIPSGNIGMTGTITVSLRRPTPVETRIEFEGGVERMDGRKIHTWARSLAGGEVLAEATAVCIARGDS